jgi:1,2-diacylglycerol 3-alpha-glucosyltransferase
MKIGIFSETYHPTINGVVVSIDTFKTELEKLGHKVYIFAPYIPGQSPGGLSVFRIPSIPFPVREYPIPLPWLSEEIRHIERLGLDVIHTQHPFFMGHIGLSLGRKLGIPVITTYHTLIAEYVKTYVPLVSGLAKRYMVYLSRRYCNDVDLVLTPSSPMREVLQSYGVNKPIEILPTGIYPAEFEKDRRKEIRKQYGIPQNCPLLLYVGRIATEKNIEMLLTAFSIVLSKHPNAYLMQVGGGPELTAFKTMASKLGVARRTIFTGFIQKQESVHYFGAADLFVFPSTTDTQGIVLTEAMAAGLPVVSVGILGPRDIVKDGKTGYLTQNDAAEFAHAIDSLLSSVARRHRMGNKAKERAQDFTAPKMAKRLEGIYRQLTEEKTSGKV